MAWTKLEIKWLIEGNYNMADEGQTSEIAAHHMMWRKIREDWLEKRGWLHANVVVWGTTALLNAVLLHHGPSGLLANHCSYQGD